MSKCSVVLLRGRVVMEVIAGATVDSIMGKTRGWVGRCKQIDIFRKMERQLVVLIIN